jgi:outer membrane protein OmpA-like peptidoglycan-associated protein
MDEGIDGMSEEVISFQAYSKFDFTPGDSIIGYEDFTQDEVGDLPARWNTSSSAEVVELSTVEGKWIQIGQGKSGFVADFIDAVPDNFTLEFDVIFDFDPDKWAYSRTIGFLLSDLEDPNYQLDREQAGKNFFRMNLVNPVGAKYFKVSENAQLNSDSEVYLDQYSKTSTQRGVPVHVSIWRQKTRVRVYVDEKKVFDVPRALEKDIVAKTLRIQSHVSEAEEFFYLGNIRYAVGKPDMRSKLLTAGKLVTYGITFDSGSAQINLQSYGTLKKIAAILNENPELQVEIIGHTDARGDEESNMNLSINRASAVEQVLILEFGVSEDQLTSSGKGESELIDQGNSPDSNAKNRRVEFVKL